MCILIDDGAMHNFLNYTLVKKLKLRETKSSHHYVVSTMKGDDHNVWDTQVHQGPLFVQEHTMVLYFQVMNMSRVDVILEHEWLHGLGLLLKQSYEQSKIAFKANGRHVLLLGEWDVPSSPLICNAELLYLEHINQIEEVFFVIAYHKVLNLMWIMFLLAMNLPHRHILSLSLLLHSL